MVPTSRSVRTQDLPIMNWLVMLISDVLIV